MSTIITSIITTSVRSSDIHKETKSVQNVCVLKFWKIYKEDALHNFTINIQYFPKQGKESNTR